MLKELKNMSTNELKSEYVTLALGNMIYNTDTKIKRKNDIGWNWKKRKIKNNIKYGGYHESKI